MSARRASGRGPYNLPGASSGASVTSVYVDRCMPYKVRTSCGHIVERKMRAATAGVPWSEDVVLSAPGGAPCVACATRVTHLVYDGAGDGRAVVYESRAEAIRGALAAWEGRTGDHAGDGEIAIVRAEDCKRIGDVDPVTGSFVEAEELG